MHFLGDGRANTHPMLAVMQTIFLRFHNMIGAKLFEINKSWNDEKLFQETRKFVIAVIQFITFNEFVPNLLGRYMAVWVYKYNIITN